MAAEFGMRTQSEYIVSTVFTEYQAIRHYVAANSFTERSPVKSATVS